MLKYMSNVNRQYIFVKKKHIDNSRNISKQSFLLYQVSELFGVLMFWKSLFLVQNLAIIKIQAKIGCPARISVMWNLSDNALNIICTVASESSTWNI